MARPDEPRSLTRKEGDERRVAVVTTVILLLPLVAMQFTDEVKWGVFDFVFAGAVLGGTGVLLELAVRKPRPIAYRVAAAAVGVAAIVLGEADDAPGLVLFGCLLIAGTIALAVRTALRTGVATTRPASQPGARPHSGSRIRSAGRRTIASSQAITEFEFHISPARSSSRPQTGRGTAATRSSSRPATRGSPVSRRASTA